MDVRETAPEKAVDGIPIPLKQLVKSPGFPGLELQHQLFIAQHCQPAISNDAQNPRKVPEGRKN
jgi:hypothetical protein